MASTIDLTNENEPKRAKIAASSYSKKNNKRSLSSVKIEMSSDDPSAKRSVTIKTESDSTTNNASRRRELMKHLNDARENTLSVDQIKAKIPSFTNADIVVLANELAGQGLVRFLQTADHRMFIQRVNANELAKIKGLLAQDHVVLAQIRDAGNTGIWSRDLKKRTGISAQPTLNKILKTLMQRELIKEVHSVESKNRKVYMLFELEPSKDITGSNWFTEGEFDQELVNTVEKLVLQTLRDYAIATPSDVNAAIRMKGVFHQIFTDYDMQLMLNSLVLDGLVQHVDNPTNLSAMWARRMEIISKLGVVSGYSGNVAGKSSELPDYYALVKNGPLVSTFNSIPCSICPVYQRCSERGMVSPNTCEYFTKWLQYDF